MYFIVGNNHILFGKIIFDNVRHCSSSSKIYIFIDFKEKKILSKYSHFPFN